MRHVTVLILSILSIHLSYSQIFEIGGFAGGSNFIGDVGKTDYISPDAPALGLLLKWNKSSRHSWRASVIYSDLIGYDFRSDDPKRIQRDYRFNSNLLEVSAGMEFNFWDFDLHSGRTEATPYIYSGISAVKFDDLYFNNGVQLAENTSSWAFGIPMVLGFKTTFINSFVLGLEVGARYTFTDGIDGSVPKNSSRLNNKFGNINNNDWYVFSGLTLTYTFGENPCYCPN
ncbi:type IX secretion system protein PorG [Changchengzhania lutea]|uniref:type IX secretion system protein PorG n=1 Tax=Changchengzhania lutea TaxID=2049305 RepID=UPI00115F180E|nr:DUF6089 family protein [Changchengzhania lutea]